MGLIYLFIIFYIISPLVFIPLYFVQLSKNKRLKRDASDLYQRNVALFAEIVRLSNGINDQQPNQFDQNPSSVNTFNYDNRNNVSSNDINNNRNNVSSNDIYNNRNNDSSNDINNNRNNDSSNDINNNINNNSSNDIYNNKNYNNSNSDYNKDITMIVPQYKTNRKSEKDSQVNTASIIMTVGVVFVILSGLIFATTSWEYLATFMRAIVMASFSAIFIASSAFAEKKLKIHKTALAFFSLGSAFIPVSVIAIGFFRLFGSWFSLYGEGKYILLFVGFAALFAAMLIGISWYSNKLFAITAWIAISLMIICIIKAVYLPNDLFSLVMAVYCSFPVIFGRNISKLKVSEKVGLFTGFAEIFAIVNTTIISIFCILFSGMDISSGISTLLFGCLYLSGIFDNKLRSIGGGSAFMIFAVIGVFRIVSPEGVSDFAAVAASISAVFAIMGMMKFFEGLIGRVLRIGSLAFVVIIIAISEIAVQLNGWTLSLVTASVIILLNLILLSLREKNRGLYFLVLISVTICISGVAAYFHYSDITTAVIISSTLAVLFLLLCVFKNNPFRYIESDVYILIATLISAIYISETSSNNYTACMYGYLIYCGILFTLSKAGKYELFRIVMKYILPFSCLTLLITPYQYLIQNGFKDETVILFSVYNLIVSTICAIQVILFKNTATHRFKSLAIFSFCGAILLPVFYLDSIAAPTIPAVSVILAIVVFVVLYREKKKVDWIFYVGASLISWTTYITVYSQLNRISTSIIAASVLSFLIATLGILLKSKKENPLSIPSAMFAMITLLIFSFTFGVCSVSDNELYWSITYFLGVLALFLLTTKTKYNLCMFIVLILFYPVVNSAILRIENVSISSGIIVIILIFTTLIGRIYQKKIIDKENGILSFDYFALLNILGILIVVDITNSPVLLWILLSLYVLNYYNRISENKYINSFVITTACFCGCVVIWIQDFVRIPQIIRDEYNVLPIIVLCFFLNKIWKHCTGIVEWVRFSSVLLSILYLSVSAIESGLSTDAVMLSIGVLGIIVVSFQLKRKKWFILGVITIVALVFYLSFQLWSSAAWWLYLLIAGGILIAIASLNELKKQKGSKGKNIFDGWGW